MQDKITLQNAKIDQIDTQLVQLLSERARVTASIRKLKKAKARTPVPVYDPKHEREVLEKITVLNKGPLDKGAMEEVFATIMGVCRQT